MDYKIIELTQRESFIDWHEKLTKNLVDGDFLVFHESRDDGFWFLTNYLQYIVRKGNSEVCLLHGKQIKTLGDIIYQINNSLPCGYEAAYRWEVLYDLLINLETEPDNRYIFLQDADYMLSSNEELFETVFEMLTISAFCNRNSITTIKEDGNRYKVNQRVFFFLNKMPLDKLLPIIGKEYYIPSIDAEGLYNNFKFNIVYLK